MSHTTNAETLAASLEAMHAASRPPVHIGGKLMRSIVGPPERLEDLLEAAALLRLADEQWRHWQGEAAKMAEQIAQLKAGVSK